MLNIYLIQIINKKLNFRIIAQKQIPHLNWVEPVGTGVRWTLKNIILPCKPTARSNFCLLAPTQFSKLIPLFGGSDPVGPGGRWAPQNKALLCKPTRGATFVCWLLLNCLSYFPHLVGWTLQAQGWSEPQGPWLNFTKQTHPKEQLLFVGLVLFSLQTPPFGGVDPAGPGSGWAPLKIKFS